MGHVTNTGRETRIENDLAESSDKQAGPLDIIRDRSSSPTSFPVSSSFTELSIPARHLCRRVIIRGEERPASTAPVLDCTLATYPEFYYRPIIIN